MAKRTAAFMVNITPIKKLKEQEEDDETVLTLAPFQQPPKVIFKDVKVGTPNMQKICVVNPSKKNIEIELEIDKGGVLDWSETNFSIPGGELIRVSVTWTPTISEDIHFSVPVKQVFPNKPSRKLSQISIVGNSISTKKRSSRIKDMKCTIQPLKEKNIFTNRRKSVNTSIKTSSKAPNSKISTKMKPSITEKEQKLNLISRERHEPLQALSNCKREPSTPSTIKEDLSTTYTKHVQSLEILENVHTKVSPVVSHKISETFIKVSDSSFDCRVSNKTYDGPDFSSPGFNFKSVLRNDTGVKNDGQVLETKGQMTPERKLDNENLSKTYVKSKQCLDTPPSENVKRKIFSELSSVTSETFIKSSDLNVTELVHEIISEKELCIKSPKITLVEKLEETFEKDSLDGSIISESNLSSCYNNFQKGLECHFVNNTQTSTNIDKQMPFRSSIYESKVKSIPDFAASASTICDSNNDTCSVNQKFEFDVPDFIDNIKFHSPQAVSSVIFEHEEEKITTRTFTLNVAENSSNLALEEITDNTFICEKSCSVMNGPINTKKSMKSSLSLDEPFCFNTKDVKCASSKEDVEVRNEVKNSTFIDDNDEIDKNDTNFITCVLKRDWKSSDVTTKLPDQDCEEDASSGLWTISPPKKIKMADSDSPEILPPVKNVYHTRSRTVSALAVNKSTRKSVSVTSERPSSAESSSSNTKSRLPDPRLTMSERKTKPVTGTFKVPKPRLKLRLSLRLSAKKETKTIETDLDDCLLNSAVNIHSSIDDSLFNSSKMAFDFSKNPFSKELLLLVDSSFVDLTEKELLKWVNVLLSPPLELKAVSMMPTTKQITNFSKACYKYNNSTNVTYRLNSVRRAGIVMLLSENVSFVLQRLHTAIDKGLLAIRNDRDLHRDVGLQEIVLKLLLCYHPLWLRVALESVFGRSLPLHSNSDAAGVVNFIRNHLLADDYLKKKYSHPTVPFLMMPGFEDEMKKFILKKFMMVVYFLDYAKQKKLIRHDPCLFCTNSPYKESSAVLLEFNREFLKGGVNVKYLSTFGYKVQHKQTYLEEFDLKVQNRNDLRDGIRLTKLMELIINCEKGSLYYQLRGPALSKFQKMHNNKVALNAFRNAGYTIENGVTEEDLINGHREKLLSLLWQLRKKIYNDAACVVQLFWKNNKDAIKQRFKFLKMKKAASKIQKWYRERAANKNPDRDMFLKLKKSVIFVQRRYKEKLECRRKRNELKKRVEASIIIQKYYRSYLEKKTRRNEYLKIRTAVINIQQRYRANVEMKKQKLAYSNMKQAVIVLESWYKSIIEMKTFRNRFLEKRNAAIVVQKAFRNFRETKTDRLQLKKLLLQKQLEKQIIAATLLQNKWRALLCMRKERSQYLNLKKVVSFVEERRLAKLSTRKEYANYKALKSAAVKLQCQWKATLEMRKERTRYLNLKKTVLRVEEQRLATLAARKERLAFIAVRNAVLNLQQHWRSIIRLRRERAQYLSLKKTVLFVEEKRIALLITRHEYSNFTEMKKAAITIQRQWRAVLSMRNDRTYYLTLKRTVLFIEEKRLANLGVRKEHTDYIAKQNAILSLQRHWRATLLMRKVRDEYQNLKKMVLLVEEKRLANLVARKEHSDFIVKQKAILSLQHHWRATLIMRKVRADYLNLKKSVLLVEDKRLAKLVTRKEHTDFITKKKATLSLQRHWRATLIMRKLRAEYQNLKKAVLLVEERRLANLVARKEYCNFIVKRKAVISLQRHWIATLLMRKERSQYLLLKKTVLLVEERRSANLVTRKARSNFIAVRKAVVTLQHWWKSVLEVKRERVYYRNLKKVVLFIEEKRCATLATRKAHLYFNAVKNATFILQRQWRATLFMKKERANYLNLKKAVTLVEEKRLAILAARKMRSHFISIRNHTVVIQKWWRTILLKKQTMNEFALQEELKKCKENTAATKIQAIWRGYKIRKMQIVKPIAPTISLTVLCPEKSLRQAGINALKELSTSSSICKMKRHLMIFDYITSLSKPLTHDLIINGLVQLLYKLMARLNRSVPEQEVKKLIINVLINIEKSQILNLVVHQVTAANKGYDGMVQCCLHFHKSNSLIFCSAVTLLWLWSFNPMKLKLIHDSSNFKYSVQVVTKYFHSLKKINRTKLQLPSKKPSCLGHVLFSESDFAWQTLMECFNRQP